MSITTARLQNAYIIPCVTLNAWISFRTRTTTPGETGECWKITGGLLIETTPCPARETDSAYPLDYTC